MHGIRLIAVSSLMAASTAWADSDPRYFDSASSGLTWDNSSTANWGVVSGGPYSSVFGSYNNAIFEGTGDTITNNGVHVNGLIFNADGYVIQGGTVTIGSPATGRYITVADGVTGTIASNLGKNGVARPLIKNGSGTLSITGATSSLDALEIHDGTFRFAGGTMTIAGDVRLGNTATDSTSVFSMEGGTVNITGGNHIFANNSKSSAIFIQTGGTFNIGGSGYLYMGNLAAPIQTVTISGGVFNATTTGPQYLAIRGDASITVNGTGAATFRNLYFGHPSVGGNGVVHLDGGTLTLSSLGLNNGTGVFNFNGGLLKVAATTASFMAGITRANIRDGGARIETPSVNATIAQALVHSNIAGDAAVDGGLTKTGSGRLTLTSGSNSYNGPTSIQQGTLEITAVGALPTASAVTISPGATLLHTINGAAIPNNVSGAGSWTLAVTSGTLNNFTLKGDNSGFDGTLTLKSGARLIVGSSQTPSASMPGATSTIVVENGAALYLTTGTGSVASSLIIRGNGPTENSPGPYGALRVDSGSVYAGDISLAADARIGSQSGNGTVGGNVSVGGHALTLNTAGSNLYFTGNLTATAAGSITKMGNYTADFSGDNSNLMGTVTVQQSNLFLSSTTASSAAAAWVVTGGTLSSALGGDPVHHLGSLAGSGGRVGTITGNTQATFVVGERGENTTYSGQIVDSTGSGNGEPQP